MNSKLILPRNFPSELATQAFRVGYLNWPACSIADGIKAISAFRSVSLAVTGGNIVIRTATDTQTQYTTAEGDYVYSFDIEPDTDEGWAEYVGRSCDEASEHLMGFTPHYPIIDPAPHTVGFMLMWESEDNHAA